MAKQTTVYYPPGCHQENEGIYITWNPYSGKIIIGGWHEERLEIEATVQSLREFFDGLGITEKDCAKAFEEKP